jgi:hypothetical protein
MRQERARSDRRKLGHGQREWLERLSGHKLVTVRGNACTHHGRAAANDDAGGTEAGASHRRIPQNKGNTRNAPGDQ